MRILIPSLSLISFAALHAAPPEITVTFPGEASHEAWVSGERVTHRMLEVADRIGDALGAPESERPKKLTVNFKHMDGVAHASGGQIYFSIKRAAALPADSEGAGIHELTHIYQGYRGYRGANIWITEGMADYVRFGVFNRGDYGYRHDPKTQNYDSSYRITGRFMGWCEAKHPGLVKALHRAMRAGGEGVPVWESHCGAKLPDLWKTYCAEQ